MRTSAPNINKIRINQYVIRYQFKKNIRSIHKSGSQVARSISMQRPPRKPEVWYFKTTNPARLRSANLVTTEPPEVRCGHSSPERRICLIPVIHPANPAVCFVEVLCRCSCAEHKNTKSNCLLEFSLLFLRQNLSNAVQAQCRILVIYQNCRKYEIIQNSHSNPFDGIFRPINPMLLPARRIYTTGRRPALLRK